MKTPFYRRRRILASSFSNAKIDALLITSAANWYYLTGFTGESGALVVSRKETTLISDGRFTVQGRAETSGIRILQQNLCPEFLYASWRSIAHFIFKFSQNLLNLISLPFCSFFTCTLDFVRQPVR